MASSPGSAVSGKEMEEDSNDPSFVIKNLDTGLEMRIDDFDRIANLATDEWQEQEHSHKKGGIHFKGSKAIKNWTTATTKKASAAAKKAVIGIKDVAQEIKHELKHELNAAQALSKHKSARTLESSSSKASSASGALSSATGGNEVPLYRANTAESSQNLDSEIGQSVGSTTSLPASEQSAISRQAQQPASTAAASSDDAASAVIQSASTHLGPAGTVANAAAVQLSLLGQPPALAANAQPAAAAASAAAAAIAPAGPTVPSAVRLVAHKRSSSAVREVVLAQVLEGSCGVVWAVGFSRDGSFLATAGQDGVLRVWQLTASRDKEPRTNWVYSTPDTESKRTSNTDIQPESEQEPQQSQQEVPEADSSSQQQQQQQPDAGAADSQGLQQEPLQQQGPEALQPQQRQEGSIQELQQQGDHVAPQIPAPQQQGKQAEEPLQPPTVEFGPYFSRQPVRVYTGHTEDILDISWSAGSFILTASLDKTVRLWHVSQPECLREFWHTDFVTSVQFHPLDAQRFVSGSIDGKIRVWSITDHTVLATAQLHQDMVTAVAFSLNGGRVMAGTMRGRCRFYDLADKKLEYVAQVDVRNQRGAHASGKKVTGICAVPGQPQQFLITTNDSRLRLLEGYGQVLKFKGHKNSSTQVRASISADGSHVVCGSDDGWAYVWQTGAGESAYGGPAGAGYLQSRGPAGGQQQQPMTGKNAVYQAFQAHELGVPVTAVAFAPAAAYEGSVSVISDSAPGGATAAMGGNNATGLAGGLNVDGQLASVAEGVALGFPSVGSRLKVQHLVVSGAFNGGIRVHELI